MILDAGNNINVTYCVICDSSWEGENTFFKNLGLLQI